MADLPAGDYLLHIKAINQRIRIRVTGGAYGPYYVASPSRLLEVTQPTPLAIQSVGADADRVRIQVGGYHPAVRVHVVATRFVPEFGRVHELSVVQPAAPAAKPLAPGYALYQSGRQIGDEHRYILERRFAPKYPGNMLERPSLLLNPWARQDTQAQQEPAASPAPPPAPPLPAMAREVAMEPDPEAARGRAPVAMSPSFDFLGEDAAVLYNLAPDENGVVLIPRADLHGRHYLQIVATDPTATASTHVALGHANVPIRDLRLAEALDPQGHVVEQKQIRVLDAGETLRINWVGESRVQIYDSIPGIYTLFTTLSNDAKLREFGFITRWPLLSLDEKRERYSQHASHELNFFLYHKDPAFFAGTVGPYLANKYAKDFMDDWLLDRDLRAYLEPWRHDQLNVVEKILLTRRLQDQAPHTVRHIADLVDLIPPNPQRFHALFMTALYGGALGSGVEQISVGGALRAGGFGGGGFGGAMGGQLQDFSHVDGAAFFQEQRFDGIRPELLGRPAEVTETVRAAAPQDAARLTESMVRVPVLEEALEARQEYRALFQAPEATREWVENQYYKLPIEQQNSGLIAANPFWLDYARHAPGTPFRSTHVAEAARNFSETMLALAVLDLPFEGGAHATALDDSSFSLSAASPLIAYFKDIQPAAPIDVDAPVLLSQNYFRADDRHRFDGNERFDKFVRDEFLRGIVYGCQITLTNPTSAPHELEVLRQVPAGALPVGSGRYLRSERMRLEPASTARLEYFFYFPLAGEFAHFPVHVSENGLLLAYAAPQAMRVVEAPSSVDMTSWQYISQQASADDVLRYLQDTNLYRIDLAQIAWRMRDRDFFDRVLALLEQRRMYHPVLWGYGVYHGVPAAIATLLTYRHEFIANVGPWLESPLLTIDPADRKSYQHVEYTPLINPRAHPLRDKWRISNDQLREQYTRLMYILAHRPALDPDDLMAVSYYMLLQDRVTDAVRYFERVPPGQLETAVQYDYFQAYLALYHEAPEQAGAIAARYADYPVPRWRTLFAQVRAQAAEATGATADGLGSQDARAAREPRLELAVTESSVTIHHKNLPGCRVNFYPIDLEMLFTRSPFAPARSGVFASVAPAATVTVAFEAGAAETEISIPEEFVNSQIVVEVEAAGIRRSDIRYASRMAAHLVEAYGQVQVLDAAQRPLPKVYVKVFARMQNRETMFYRDGYTDLRGRFDYASSSTLDLGQVSEFVMLVFSDEHGAKVLTAAPPAR
jgi:hypothetical protein